MTDEFTHVYDVGVLILFIKKGKKTEEAKFGKMLNVDRARPYCQKAEREGHSSVGI